MVEITRLTPPEQWVAKQISTLKAVGEKNYRDGIARPKKDPIKAGIEAEAKFADSMRKVIEEERRASGLKATNMDEWYAYASELGAPRLVQGVVKRQAKVTKFVAAFQPMLKSHLGKIDTMADVSDADREARMLENLRGLKAMKGAWKKNY